jgi:hypothetical protein
MKTPGMNIRKPKERGEVGRTLLHDQRLDSISQRFNLGWKTRTLSVFTQAAYATGPKAKVTRIASFIIESQSGRSAAW